MPRKRKAKGKALTLPPSPGFMDLPDELLLMIVRNFQKNRADLYSLATSCKRLNHFVLPIYFKTFRMTRRLNKSGTSASSSCHRFYIRSAAFPGLSIAFFITALSVASCTYDGTNYRRVGAFRRAISRMESVSAVNLKFSATQLVAQCVDDDARWETVLRGMRELPGILNALSSKSCSDLKLKGEPLAVQDEGAEEMPPQIQPLTQLVSFHGERIAFSPTLKDCIIESLNASPIEKLSLQGLIASEWNDILPRLTLSSLTKLDVGSLDLSPGAVFAFLIRHPTVTEFIISGTASLRRPTRLSAGSYPYVVRLQSDVQGMYYLLGARTKNAFPNLQSIAVTTQDRIGAPETYLGVMDLVLDRLTHRDHVHSISIDIPTGGNIIQWLNVPASQHSQRAESRLDGILSVEIDHIPGEGSVEAVAAVSRWLALFPSVQLVSIRKMRKNFTVDDEVVFARAVAEAQPQIQTVLTRHNLYQSDQNWLPAT